MLNVIVSDYFMQFQRKLMNQIWKMAENLALGPILVGFGPNLVLEELFCEFYL